MYAVLDNAQILSNEEINARYDGKWVFLTNCEFTPGSRLICGIPRVIADKQAEGVDDGVYDTYKDIEQFGEKELGALDRSSVIRFVPGVFVRFAGF